MFENLDTRNYDILILYISYWNSKLDPKFHIWADLVSSFQYNLIFMKIGIQHRENTLILNILFENYYLVPNFGPTIEKLNKLMKFGTKNKWNILIDIHCLDSGQISF